MSEEKTEQENQIEIGPQASALDLEVDHDGTTAFVRGWINPESNQSPMIVVHDLFENSTLYRDFGKEIAQYERNAFFYDVRGHGRSGRKLGHFETFDNHISDLLQVAAWAKHKTNGKTPIILGHGIGAVIALNFSIKYPKLCACLVLSAPTFELSTQFSAVQRFVIKTLSDTLPKVRLPRNLTPKMSEQVRSGDNLIFSTPPESASALTAQSANELFLAMETARLKFMRIKSHTLVIIPEKDRATRFQVLENLISRHKRRQFIKVLKLPQLSHNYLIEDRLIIKDVTNQIIAWVNQVEEMREGDQHATSH